MQCRVDVPDPEFQLSFSTAESNGRGKGHNRLRKGQGQLGRVRAARGTSQTHLCQQQFHPNIQCSPSPSPHVPTVIVCVHLPEDLVCSFLRRGLIFGHLHHGGHHLVDGLQRSIYECAQEYGGWHRQGRALPLCGRTLLPSEQTTETRCWAKRVGKVRRCLRTQDTAPLGWWSNRSPGLGVGGDSVRKVQWI